ncbi:MAG: hypothetical protein JO322_13555 [Candidatus Eremiobacteraeota bacterium]|nr:hypothetical protein [Candidatus Eremiobacteraeota bacterium]
MGIEQHSLATYVSDMLAVERHIRIPFEVQRADKDVTEYSDAANVINRLVALSDMHIDALVAQLERLGGHEASPIKSAVTQVEGALAGAIDKVRKTKVSKALRDDYTALALCTISYAELLATADGLGDPEIADLSKRHLADYANAMMKICEYVPGVVVRELQTIGLELDSGTVDRSRQSISECWQQTSRPFHEDAATTFSSP